MIQALLSQLRFQNIYGSIDLLRTAPDGKSYLRDAQSLAAPGMQIIWLYRLVPVAWTLAVSLLLDDAQRKEFRVRLLLKRQQDLRIEQLQREKEHLDWDRRLLEKSVSRSVSDSLGHPRDGPEAPHGISEMPLGHQPSAPSVGASSCAELELIMTDAADAQREQGARSMGSSSTGAAAAAAAAAARTAEHQGVRQLPVSTIPAGGSPPQQHMRMANDRIWSETRTLAELRVKRPGSGRPASGVSGIQSGISSSSVSEASSDLESAQPVQICRSRELALWRTLQASGLISPASCSSVTVPPSAPASLGSSAVYEDADDA